MTFKKKDTGQLIDQGISENLDYPKLLFWQIDRISRLTTELDARCIKGVDVLEALLTPHHDVDYVTEAKTIFEKYIKEKKKYTIGKNIDSSIRQQIEFNRAMRKFRSLMNLISRRNLLPEKRGSYDESGNQI